MPDQNDFIAQLRARRHDYGDERVWHKFLLDAYAGTGGFQGRVRMPFASYWGYAADVYTSRSATDAALAGKQSEATLDTYLDRFPREDDAKFRARHSTAQYLNHVEPIVDIRMSYMTRKNSDRDVPPALAEWMENADGKGTPWGAFIKRVIAPRCAWVGWCPVLFDKPMTPEGYEGEEMSVAQAAELGLRTRAIPLWPGNLLDWDLDENDDLVWVKVMVPSVERADALGPERHLERITIWERTRIRRWTVELASKANGGKDVILEESEMPNALGVVPMVFFHHKPSPTDPVRGLPMAGALSILGRKVFNYLSEIDEHIRQSVFALFVWPVKEPSKAGPLTIGATNALAVSMDATIEPKWIAPPPQVAATLEKRIEATVLAIYQIGRSEYQRSSGAGQAQSGISRAFQFEGTNRAIADFAANVAEGEEVALGLVAKMEGIPADNVRVTPPQKFDVEEMQREIDEALAALTLKLGPTASVELKRRLLAKLLPNLPEERVAQIEAELEEQALAAEQERAAMREMQEAAARNGAPDPGQDDDDDDADDDG
jgi:hypothetical protein